MMAATLYVLDREGLHGRQTRFRRPSQAFVPKSGCKPFRFHDLRHSHASQLLKSGVHPKVVSERLGHSSVSITLDTYSHVLPGMQQDAVRLIDVALRTAIKTKRAMCES